jgi:glycosyltransferase involved in cell wall biosynthesis
MASIAHKEAGKCDVMISGATAWDFPGLLADFLAKKHNLPHIIYPHGLFDPWVMQFKKYRKQIYWHLIAKYTLNRAAKIIALTKSEKEAIENLNIKAPIEVIPNGINSAEFTSVLTRKELDELYPSLKDKTFLIYMSRIHPKKGLDMLIPAFNSLLNDKKDDIKLVLAGQVDDSYTYAFNRLLLSNNKNNIITIGHVKGKLKNSLLKYASGFLLTSYSEGLPMAVLEAMSAGCPVIISNQCNLPEVKEYNAGIVVLNNVIEIKAAIIDILYNKESTITKIINAKKLIEEKFTWEMVGKKTDEIIRNIINP